MLKQTSVITNITSRSHQVSYNKFKILIYFFAIKLFWNFNNNDAVQLHLQLFFLWPNIKSELPFMFPSVKIDKPKTSYETWQLKSRLTKQLSNQSGLKYYIVTRIVTITIKNLIIWVFEFFVLLSSISFQASLGYCI